MLSLPRARLLRATLGEVMLLESVVASLRRSQTQSPAHSARPGGCPLQQRWGKRDAATSQRECTAELLSSNRTGRHADWLQAWHEGPRREHLDSSPALSPKPHRFHEPLSVPQPPRHRPSAGWEFQPLSANWNYCKCAADSIRIFWTRQIVHSALLDYLGSHGIDRPCPQQGRPASAAPAGASVEPSQRRRGLQCSASLFLCALLPGPTVT